MSDVNKDRDSLVNTSRSAGPSVLQEGGAEHEIEMFLGEELRKLCMQCVYVPCICLLRECEDRIKMLRI